MLVKKRSGELQEFDPTKILERIQKQAQGLKVDSTHVYLQINNVLYDGISTKDIDMEAARLAASFTSTHPDYSKLASNLVVSRLHKELGTDLQQWLIRTPDSTKQYFVKAAEKWKIKLEDFNFNYSTDYGYDYFGIQTFINVYGLKENGVLLELPCEMYARVAVLTADTFEEYCEIYEALVQKKLSVATPILLNAATNKNSLISCSLNSLKEDSKEGIFDTLKDIGTMSSESAGIGLWMGNLRSKETLYRQKGKAGGHIKAAKMVNETIQFFQQSENRRGKAAIYLDLWHKDVIDHLNLRRQTTKEEKAARDLFPAVCIPDLFYKRLLQDETTTWSLFCPHESLSYIPKPLYDTWGEEFEQLYHVLEQSACSRNTISCKELMTEIVASAAETGTPYIFNRDTVNRTYNQSNWGVAKSSNLCISPETEVLTKNGYVRIEDLAGTETEVWNGNEWSLSKIFKTSDSEKLVKINFSNDSEIHATLEHRWYLYDTSKGTYSKKVIVKKTKDLMEGDVLVNFDFPIIPFEEELKYAYTQGLFTADGSYTEKGYPLIKLYDVKQKLIPFLDLRNKYFSNNKQEETDSPAINEDIARNFTMVGIKTDIKPKYFVPLEYSLNSKLRWLEGLVDGDGCLLNNNGTYSIQLSSSNYEFLQEVKKMLNLLGCSVEISVMLEEGLRSMPDGKGGNKDYNCATSYRLFINNYNLFNLKTLGFSPNRLLLDNVKQPNRKCNRLIKVTSIEDVNRIDKTYCLHEPILNRFVANSIITGNCIEYHGYSDAENAAQCCLCSIPVYNFVKADKTFDFKGYMKAITLGVKVLNKIVDINHWSTESARKAGTEQRTIGVGVAGLADMALKMDLAFTSEEFIKINKEISAVMYYTAVKASCDLAKANPEKAKALTKIQQTPLAKGVLHCKDEFPNDYGIDVNQLIADLIMHGVMNSLLIAPMPTASTSILLSCNEMFEALSGLVLSRETVTGVFTFFNKYLVEDLEVRNLWCKELASEILVKESLSEIDLNKYCIEPLADSDIAHLKEKYKTVREISMKTYINMCADRQKYVDQGMSMNLYFKEATLSKIMSAFVHSWQMGLKTGVYYTVVKPVGNSDKKLAVSFVEKKVKPATSQFECFNCGS